MKIQEILDKCILAKSAITNRIYIVYPKKQKIETTDEKNNKIKQNEIIVAKYKKDVTEEIKKLCEVIK